jgi:hypothetical protein
MALVEKQADLPELVQLIQCDTIYCDYLLTRTTYSSTVAIPEAVKSVVLGIPGTPKNGILGRETALGKQSNKNRDGASGQR